MTALDVAYCRISSDRTGAGLGVGSQLEAIRATAARAGLDADSLYVITDNDVSAYDRRKVRAGYSELMEMLTGGRVRRLFIWHNDRLHRQPRELESFIDAVEHNPIEIRTVVSGDMDLSTPVGRMVARTVGAQARLESEIKTERLRLMHDRKRKAGEWSGGRRSFGYNRDMTAQVPAEAAAIQDAATRILNGESIASIVRRWTETGVRTTTGKEWRTTNVGALMRRKYLAGVREYDGKDVRASWAPIAILDAGTHAAVCRVLADRTRPGMSSGYQGGRTYALSGLVLCATCGHRMYGRPTRLKSGPAYVCRNGQHTQAPVSAVDGTVKENVVRRLVRVDAAGAFVTEDDRDAAEARATERENLEARRDRELPAAFAMGHMTPAQVEESTRTINARLAELEDAAHAETDARLRPARVLSGLVGLSVEDTAAEFDALPVDRQRAVIEWLGTPILRRAGRGGRHGFNPNRIRFAWVDDAESGN